MITFLQFKSLLEDESFTEDESLLERVRTYRKEKQRKKGEERRDDDSGDYEPQDDMLAKVALSNHRKIHGPSSNLRGRYLSQRIKLKTQLMNQDLKNKRQYGPTHVGWGN